MEGIMKGVLNQEGIIRTLIALRKRVEQEADAPIQDIECTMLTALYDVCAQFDIDDSGKRRVLGDAMNILNQQPVFMIGRAA